MLIFCLAGWFQTAAADEDGGAGIIARLQAGPFKSIREIPPVDGFQRAFEILLPQPLDHSTPNSPTFHQRIILQHFDDSRPVVFVTEGYQINEHRADELSVIFQANQIRVEHRFFGESVPDSLDWQYLTVRQAAGDHHRIRAVFREIYPQNEWVSTGISKGGQTALFYRRYYPDDVHATVAYVSPIPKAVEDPRLDEFLETVGSDSCRRKINAFQQAVLKQKDAMLPLLEKWAVENNETFSIGLEAALEYSVLEYPFSFWQWGRGNCNFIPRENDDIEMIFNELRKVSGFSLYSDSGIRRYEPSFYQMMTELGYYGFIHDHLSQYLTAVPNPSNLIFAPQNSNPVYRPETMHDISRWLEQEGHRILYVYGELDTWTGAAVNPAEQVTALKMVKKGGHHRTRIRSFGREDQDKMISTVRDWLYSGRDSQSGFNRKFLLFNSLFMIAAVVITFILVMMKMKRNSSR